MMIAALFIDERGGYVGLPRVDAWGKSRDARKYKGPFPVVAHPPCSTWCQLAYVNEARWGHKVGDDAGCFESALRSVRSYGGVLEHPAHSIAWARFELPRPIAGCWMPGKKRGEWVAQVSQRAYGHRARKMTWLLYCGQERPFDLDWRTPAAIAMVGKLSNNGGQNLPRLEVKEARATPPRFRSVLLRLARHASICDSASQALSSS